jgi:lysophospholipase L1-like esterase
MKLSRYTYCLITLCLLITAKEQFGQVYKFDFGSGKSAPGYIQITPQTTFNYKTGYGFDQGSVVESIDRGGDALTGDFITANKPFYFSVKLPDGNYDVKLILGDSKGSSATTVRTECRRLMLENIRTQKGKFSVQTITIHVKDSVIRNAEGQAINKVRLKPREVSYLHWDNLLTLEFNDSLPKVAAMEISVNHTATTIFLAGNSTVVDQDREPWCAWGQIFPRFLIPSKVVIANYAESGETLRAFKGERRLDKIWSLVKPGDYLFIEFAHNDQKAGSSHLDPFTTYRETLKEWIMEARKRKVNPVLVTSMNRRTFDSSGHITNSLLEYPEAMRQTGREENVPVIDLNAMSKTLYESLGPELTLKAFVHFPANSFPNQPEAFKDNTHFTPYGATQLARCIIESIREQKLPLANYIRKDVPRYDPVHPLMPDKFYWPQSPLVAAIRPDGN